MSPGFLLISLAAPASQRALLLLPHPGRLCGRHEDGPVQENRPGSPRQGLASVSRSAPEPGDARRAFPGRKGWLREGLNTAGKTASGPMFKTARRCCCYWCPRKPECLSCVCSRPISSLLRQYLELPLWCAPTKACCAYASYNPKNVKVFQSLLQTHTCYVHKWVSFWHRGILGRINLRTSAHTWEGVVLEQCSQATLSV